MATSKPTARVTTNFLMRKSKDDLATLVLDLLEVNALLLEVVEIPAVERVHLSANRRRRARQLRNEGYSIRQIMRRVGWKSPRSVMLALNEWEAKTSEEGEDHEHAER